VAAAITAEQEIMTNDCNNSNNKMVVTFCLIKRLNGVIASRKICNTKAAKAGDTLNFQTVLHEH